jgi:dihydrofolate reductase
MRRIRYSVAMSLDGFIAGPKGEYDWIAADPSYDFDALWNQFDTLLMGRRTYEVALTRFDSIEKMGKKVVVVSTTLESAQHPGVSLIRSDLSSAIATLKAQPGKDIWLMGGGVLFRSLLDAELVDDVELAVIPVLLGGGVPVLPEGIRHQLKLVELKRFPNGTLSLVYSAAPQSTPKSATTARNFKQSKTRPTPKSPNTKKRKP